MTAPPTTPTKTPPGHGWRITWPMVLGWLTMAASFAPILMPYLTGERKLDAAAYAFLFGCLVATLNHSPMPTPGGGVPRVPPTAGLLLLALVAAAYASGCATWRDTMHGGLDVAAHAVVVADDTIADSAHRDCDPAVAGLAPGSPERAAAGGACLSAHRYTDAAGAVVVAVGALRAAERLLDASSTTLATWAARVPCLLAAFREMVAALTAAAIALPPDVVGVADTLADTFGDAATGSCNAETTP